MAYISSFVYCESVQGIQTQDGIKANIIAPLLVISLKAIPSEHSFAMSVGIQGIDTAVQNTIRLDFHDPDGGLASSAGPISVPMDIPFPKNFPLDRRGVILNMDFRNVLFPKEGVYQTSVILNGEKLKELKIPVVWTEKDVKK